MSAEGLDFERKKERSGVQSPVEAELASFGRRLPSLVADGDDTDGGRGDDVVRQRLQSSTMTVFNGRRTGLVRAHCGERLYEHRSEGFTVRLALVAASTPG